MKIYVVVKYGTYGREIVDIWKVKSKAELRARHLQNSGYRLCGVDAYVVDAPNGRVASDAVDIGPKSDLVKKWGKANGVKVEDFPMSGMFILMATYPAFSPYEITRVREQGIDLFGDDE